MTPFTTTMQMLIDAKFPVINSDTIATVSYWLERKGYTPERIVREIFGVQR